MSEPTPIPTALTVLTNVVRNADKMVALAKRAILEARAEGQPDSVIADIEEVLEDLEYVERKARRFLAVVKP